MIDVAVMRFIGTDDEDDVAQTCVERELPVVDGNRRGRDVDVVAVVHAGQILGVTEHCLLFQITDDAVRGSRRDGIEQKEQVVKTPCATRISRRSSREGWAIWMKVIRCMRLFSASSSSVRIQP